MRRNGYYSGDSYRLARIFENLASLAIFKTENGKGRNGEWGTGNGERGKGWRMTALKRGIFKSGNL